MRKIFGFILVLHGLAHAGAGMNATGNPWLITVLWLFATAAFTGSGLWMLGAQFNWPRVDRATFAGAVASIWLLSYFPYVLLIPGIALNFSIVALLQVWVAATVPLPTKHPRLRRVGTWVSVAGFVYTLVVVALHPWFHRMGTTADDRAARLLGDSLHQNPGNWVITNNAITIHAPADSVWLWVAPIGQDRRIDAVEPGRAMLLHGWGTFAVRPIDSTTSKFHVRQWMPKDRSLFGFVMAAPEVLIFQPMHFLMQRGMLRGVRARAERAIAKS